MLLLLKAADCIVLRDMLNPAPYPVANAEALYAALQNAIITVCWTIALAEVRVDQPYKSHVHQFSVFVRASFAQLLHRKQRQCLRIALRACSSQMHEDHACCIAL